VDYIVGLEGAIGIDEFGMIISGLWINGYGMDRGYYDGLDWRGGREVEIWGILITSGL